MLQSILQGGSPRNVFINLITYVSAILLAIVVHEWAHGFIALKNGDETAKMYGRLTLNPLKHFDPFGLIMFFVVGIGWAKPVPINSNNFKNYRKGIFTVAIAGVCANLIMTFGAGALIAITLLIVENVGISNAFSEVFFTMIYRFLFYSLVINVSLIAFNLLPIFPLDGFRIVEAFSKTENKYITFMRRYGIFVLFGFILISDILGMINPYLDIFGMYVGSIQRGIFWIISKIFNVPII
ncbi:MAG: site-2 protease family protein [Clostridia bacterium]